MCAGTLLAISVYGQAGSARCFLDFSLSESVRAHYSYARTLFSTGLLWGTSLGRRGGRAQKESNIVRGGLPGLGGLFSCNHDDRQGVQESERRGHGSTSRARCVLPRTPHMLPSDGCSPRPTLPKTCMARMSLCPMASHLRREGSCQVPPQLSPHWASWSSHRLAAE